LAVSLNEAEALEVLAAVRDVLADRCEAAVGVTGGGQEVYDETLRAIAPKLRSMPFKTADATALIAAVA
jgi:hypothetical protein